jgi:hypothetical protein
MDPLTSLVTPLGAGAAVTLRATNMARTSLTSVGSEADLPEPLLRLSPATGPDADMLEVYDPDSGYNAET